VEQRLRLGPSRISFNARLAFSPVSGNSLEMAMSIHAPPTTARAASGSIGRYRWVICGLLFFSTTVNYLDRQVISYLKEFFCTPSAQGAFGLFLERHVLPAQT